MKHKESVSVLLLAADSGEGALGEMIHPVLRERFAEEGINVRASYVSDLKRQHLDLFDVVALLRTPIPGHPHDDHADFLEKGKWLVEYVESGGGLFLMFTECYGKTVEPLNEICEPLGIHFYFNRLEPSSDIEEGHIRRFPEGRVLPFECARNSCLDLSFSNIGLITEGGHGTQHLTCMTDESGPGNWQPILLGSDRVQSKPYEGEYINTSKEIITNPVVCTAAEIGNGRVIAFPASAPFWVVDSHIWRFEGYLQEQNGGRGFEFFKKAFRWIADTDRNRSLQADSRARAEAAIDERLLLKPERFSFVAVGVEQQERMRNSEPRKIWVGEADCDSRTLSVMARRLRDRGYILTMPLADYSKLDTVSWEKLLHDSEEASTQQHMPVVPGYEFTDEEGVRSAVVMDVLPVHGMKYPNSTLLEDVWVPHPGAISILRGILRNRISPERYGGYNLLEWEASGEWFALYRRLLASKYFVSPVALNHSSEGKDEINTWVLVPDGETPIESIRRNHHASYVSDGPRLEQFAILGPNLIDDEWEGYWYGYYPGDAIKCLISISSDAPISEIVLHDGEEVFCRFTPGTGSFAREITFQAWRDYSLHLTAVDENRRRIYATFPLYTRNLGFWGHVGSDQMNNYINVASPARNGFIGVGDKMHDMFGFATLGAGWGDYIRMAPSISNAKYMPHQEISFMVGSFRAHHPSAMLADDSGACYLNDHRRLFSYCGADAQAVLSDIAGQHIDNNEGIVQRWHGKELVPTRIFLSVEGTNCRDTYVIWRWEEDELILTEVRKEFEVDTRYLKDEWLTFSSNSHCLLPGLHVRSLRKPSHRVSADTLPRLAKGEDGIKEWDNAHYLGRPSGDQLVLFEPEEGAEIEIGEGHIGTFAFLPLGRKRRYRAAMLSDGDSLDVLFQCRLTREERSSGRFTIEYLMTIDTVEEQPTAASLLARDIDLFSSGGDARRFSFNLDCSHIRFPAEVDLDVLFPEAKGKPLYLKMTGLPAGTIAWKKRDDTVAFCSQPKKGESYHIFTRDTERRFRLEFAETTQANR